MILDTLFDVNNLANKVIVHYNRTGPDNQVLDLIVDADQLLESIKVDGEIEIIPAKHAKRARACLPLNLDELVQQAETQFDLASIKMGYAWTMPVDPVKGRQIKLAKKETELRQLFGLTDDKKASFWSHEWDNINLDSLDTKQKKLSFIRGVFSAKATIRPGPKGYIAFNWDGLYKVEAGNDEDRVGSFLDFFGGNDLFEHYPNLEYNGDNVFFATRDQIGNYIKNIGFVQKKKLETALVSYRLHLRMVNDVVPITSNYLLYHVQNYHRAPDYDVQLLDYYDINAQDPKTGRTPLITSIVNAKYTSLYPALWLLENGADITIQSKKEGNFEAILYSDILDNYGRYRRDCPEITHLCLIMADKLSSDAQQYTHNLCRMMINSDLTTNQLSEMISAESLAKTDKSCLLASLIEQIAQTSYSLRFQNKDDELTNFLTIIIDYSSEDLQTIYNLLLNEILIAIEKREPDINKFGNRNNCRTISGFYLYIPLFDILNQRVTPDPIKIQTIQTKIDQLSIDIYRYEFPSHCFNPDRTKPLQYLLDLSCDQRCFRIHCDYQYTSKISFLTKLVDQSTEDLPVIYDLVLNKLLKLATDHDSKWYNTIYHEKSDLYLALFDILSQRVAPDPNKIQTIQNVMDENNLKFDRANQTYELLYPVTDFNKAT